MLKKIFLLIILIFWVTINFNSFAISDREAECLDGDCLDQASFKLHVWQLSPWDDDLIWSDTEETMNNILQTIITKLMIWFWTVSLFIMTVWWWYMILYNWKDELLTKWKSIFMSWWIWLVVALLSWAWIKIVIYLIYT